MLRKETNKLIIHCTGTKDGKTYHATDIDRWHKQRGWDGIGYHLVLLPSGEIEPGRPWNDVGAHAYGHNHDSLALVMVGRGRYTENAWIVLAAEVTTIQHQYPGIKVMGHNELTDLKTCPGFNVQDWLNVGKVPLASYWI